MSPNFTWKAFGTPAPNESVSGILQLVVRITGIRDRLLAGDRLGDRTSEDETAEAAAVTSMTLTAVRSPILDRENGALFGVPCPSSSSSTERFLLSSTDDSATLPLACLSASPPETDCGVVAAALARRRFGGERLFLAKESPMTEARLKRRLLLLLPAAAGSPPDDEGVVALVGLGIRVGVIMTLCGRTRGGF